MTATGAPLRVSSISSPPATRFRTAEKLLAASVAVMRDTAAPYQINQTPARTVSPPYRPPRSALLDVVPDRVRPGGQTTTIEFVHGGSTPAPRSRGQCGDERNVVALDLRRGLCRRRRAARACAGAGRRARPPRPGEPGRGRRAARRDLHAPGHPLRFDQR